MGEIINTAIVATKQQDKSSLAENILVNQSGCQNRNSFTRYDLLSPRVGRWSGATADYFFQSHYIISPSSLSICLHFLKWWVLRFKLLTYKRPRGFSTSNNAPCFGIISKVTNFCVKVTPFYPKRNSSINCGQSLCGSQKVV